MHTNKAGEISVDTNKGFNMEGAGLEAFADQIEGSAKYPISDDDVIYASEALEKIFVAAGS